MNSNKAQGNIILLYESEVIFKRFQSIFGSRYQFFWGKDLNSTMRILSRGDIGVMICDIHYQNQDIYPVVLALNQLHPELVTMIVTQSDNAKLVAELEAQKEIFAALVRPVTQRRLSATLDAAFISYISKKPIVSKHKQDTSNTFSAMSLTEAIRSRSYQSPDNVESLDDDLALLDTKSLNEVASSETDKALQDFDSLFFDDPEYNEK